MKKPRKPKAKTKRTAHRPAAPRAALRPVLVPKSTSSARRLRVDLSLPVSLGRLLRGGYSGRDVFNAARWQQGVTTTISFARRAGEIEVGPLLESARRRVQAVAVSYSADEREVLALLFLPFLILATALTINQSLDRFVRDFGLVVEQPLSPEAARRQAIAAHPAMPLQSIRPERVFAPIAAGDALQDRGGPVVLQTNVPSEIATSTMDVVAARGVDGDIGVAALAQVPGALSSRPVESVIAGAKAVADEVRQAARPAAMTDRPPTPMASARVAEDRLALLLPPTAIRPRAADAVLPPSALPRLDAPVLVPPALATWDEGESAGANASAGAGRMCVAEPKAAPVSFKPGVTAAALSPEEFGMKLAAAAQAQVDGFVIYNDAYSTISYPNGDVSELFGVCTDVVVRAYRAMGLDLQVLVQQARAGTGDRNIDHRRTEVLRKFFAGQGESLPITDFPDDYRPGDIVSYYRPQNQHTRSHIAIVSSVMAPSGRLMIVHNRGWGPQLEDGLFVDQITGHFRYSGPRAAPQSLRQDRADQTGGATTRLATSQRETGGVASVVKPASFSPAGAAPLQSRPLRKAQR